MNIELSTTDPSKTYIELDPDFEGVIVVKKGKILTIPKAEFDEEFKEIQLGLSDCKVERIHG